MKRSWIARAYRVGLAPLFPALLCGACVEENGAAPPPPGPEGVFRIEVLSRDEGCADYFCTLFDHYWDGYWVVSDAGTELRVRTRNNPGGLGDSEDDTFVYFVIPWSESATSGAYEDASSFPNPDCEKVSGRRVEISYRGGFLAWDSFTATVTLSCDIVGDCAPTPTGTCQSTYELRGKRVS